MDNLFDKQFDNRDSRASMWAIKQRCRSIRANDALLGVAFFWDIRTGIARCRIADISERICLSVPTTTKYLQQIYEDGLIIWREPSDPRDHKTPHEFELVGYDSK